MLAFRVGQNSVRVTGSERELKSLRTYLTLKKKNAYWQKWGDGSIRFLGRFSKQFAYGLWSEVKQHCKSNGIQYKAYTSRAPLDPLPTSKIGPISLDEKQTKACDRWFARGGSGIVWAGAGFGKTEVASAIINQMLKRQLASRVLFIVNTLDLLDQATERLHSRLGLKVGLISGKSRDIKTVTVANIQSIDKGMRDPKKLDPFILQYLASVDFIVFDEVHHGRSEQSARLSKYCSAKYRLGLSARPLYISHDKYQERNLQNMKADDARVLAFLGPIVYRAKPSDLIESGRLAKPIIYLYPLGYDDWLHGDWLHGTDAYETLDWTSARKRFIIENDEIIDVTRKCVLAAARAGETSLVVAGNSKQLGLRAYTALHDAHLNVAYLHGSVDKAYRTKSRHRLTKKQLEAVVATTIYDEGIDVPRLRLLVLAYGGLSPFKNEQRLGRGLREKLGTNQGIIIEFMNYSNRILRRHSYARLEQYLEESAYELRLVTKNHPPKVRRLVPTIVNDLPDTELFRRLRDGKRQHQQPNKGNQKVSHSAGVR